MDNQKNIELLEALNVHIEKIRAKLSEVERDYGVACWDESEDLGASYGEIAILLSSARTHLESASDAINKLFTTTKIKTL